MAVQEAITVTVDVVSSASYLWAARFNCEGKTDSFFSLKALGNMEIALPHHNDHDSHSPKARLLEFVIICFN